MKVSKRFHIRRQGIGKGKIRKNPNSSPVKWSKRTISNNRYELVGDGYTIDVSYHPYQVSVYKVDYGGWIHDTPRNFKNIPEMNKFIREVKAKISRGLQGRRVPFPM